MRAAPGPPGLRAADLLRERLEPLKPPSYRRMAAALMVTNLGNGMQFIANVWLILEMTDDPWGVPVVLLTAALPGVMFGPLIGMAMDRFPRRLLFVITDLSAATALSLTTLLVITEHLETWHVYAIVFVLGLVESTAMPTGAALVREIVPVDKLLPANATSGVAIQVGQAAGAAIGGLLIATTSVAVVLVVNLVSFLLSASLVIGLRDAGRSHSAPSGEGGWRATMDWSREGLTYLRTHPKMLPSYVMLLLLFATLYMLNTLLAPFAVDVLLVGPGGLGLIDAMFALGAVAGGVALPLLTARLNRDRLAGVGVIGLGLALAGMGLSHGLVAPMMLYAAMGISFQAFYIFRTRVQESVPVDLQGRVMALIITSVGVCRLIVYGTLAVSAGAVTLRATYLAVGALLAVLGIFVTVAAFRRSDASTGARRVSPGPSPAGGAVSVRGGALTSPPAAQLSELDRPFHTPAVSAGRRRELLMTVQDHPTPPRRPAVILLGGLVATWNHRFLHAAERRGLEVLLVDGPTSGIAALHERGLRSGAPHPLARVAGNAVHSGGDSAGVLEACLTWARDFDVRGVCCLREEYVESAGLVTDLLGLPSPGLRASRVCRNKYLQRRYLAAWSPASELIGPGVRLARATTWDRFPAVVKPVGRLASSGVHLVLTTDELLSSLDDYSSSEVLQFEERIFGPEYSVESLSRDGVTLYAEVTEKWTTEGDSPFFVELGHTTPAVHLDEAARATMLATHAAVLDRLHFGTGITHGEYRITGDGRVVLTEVAVRPPGDSIMALHWLATGFSLEDAVLGLMVGADVDPPATPAHRYARQVYLPHSPGVLDAVDVDREVGMDLTWFDAADVRDQISSGSKVADPPSLRCLLGLKPVGTTLGPLRESADRAAMFVVDAQTPDELDAIEDSVRRGTRLRVTR